MENENVIDLLLNNELPKPQEKEWRVKRLSKAFGRDFIVTIKQLSYSTVKDLIRLHRDDEEMDLHTVLAGLKEPDFKDKALLDRFHAETPVDALEKVFLPGEITDISRQIQRLSGYLTNVLEEVKKN